MKITITNAYSYHNKGDAGILLGTINLLKKIYGKRIEINILSFTPNIDKKIYLKDKCVKRVESNILNPHPYKHTKLGKLIAILKLVSRTFYLKFMIKFFKNQILKKEISLKLISDSDLVIVCGGGFLGGKKFDSLMHLFQIDANTKYNDNVILMGNSIEPINNIFLKNYTEKILKKVKFLMARESITYDYLNTFLDSNKFSLIPDLAFMLEDKYKSFKEINNFKKDKKYIVGITVRNWNFPNSNGNMEKYINVIKNVIVNYVERSSAGFVFIPQVIVNHANDINVAKEIKKILPEHIKKSFLIIEDDLSPLEIKSLIGNMNYFIGTRMHSNIFALSMKVPTLAISYEMKTNGIMNMLDLDDYIVSIDSISENELITKFDNLISNSVEIKNKLYNKIDEIRYKLVDVIEKILK